MYFIHYRWICRLKSSNFLVSCAIYQRIFEQVKCGQWKLCKIFSNLNKVVILSWDGEPNYWNLVKCIILIFWYSVGRRRYVAWNHCFKQKLRDHILIWVVFMSVVIYYGLSKNDRQTNSLRWPTIFKLGQIILNVIFRFDLQTLEEMNRSHPLTTVNRNNIYSLILCLKCFSGNFA